MQQKAFRTTRSCGLALLVVLSHAAHAAAEEARDSAPLDEEAAIPPRRFGLMFDVGSVEGGMLSLTARAFSLGSYRHSPRLEHFDYDYDFVSLHLGWETECAGLLFFAQGGASLLWTKLPVASSVADFSNGPAAGSVEQPFWLVLPSLRLGFIGLL